jgi:carboxyl-terminal processing protease
LIMRRRLTLLNASVAIVLGLAVTGPDRALGETKAQTAIESDQRDRLVAALQRIRASYVDEVDPSKLVTAAINGMMTTLDSQSVYFDRETFRDLQILHGPPAGLGLEATLDDGLVRVLAPLDESPAAKAGVMVNDVITHIDGVPLQGLKIYQVFEKMRGPVNTAVRLTIMRNGRDTPVELTIVREVIRVRSVRIRQDGSDIGYIRIAAINEQTTGALTSAVSELSSQIPPDKMKGYVLDLRNTPFGLLDLSISVADAFLEDGEIVSVRGRSPDQIEHFDARPGDIINGKPLIVLINGGSAGGAEIVAGALQDRKRATVIGSRSFGLGSMQSILPLRAGGGALRLTTGRYFTPAGRSIHAAGILPDIEVRQDFPQQPENDRALAIAFNLLRGTASDQPYKER